MTGAFVPDRRNKKVYAQINRLKPAMHRSVRHGFFDLGKDLRQTASQNILKRPKGGRTYIIRTRGGRRRRHVASAPGETHANLSGRLRRSLGWKVRGSSEMEFGYGVDKDTTEYAPFVEDGTRRMAARPSLKIAVNETTRNAENYFGRRFKDEIR
jgi:HK97 gp10 family phage protein